MPPGKKTLACVFAGANVLGTRKRDYRSVLYKRCFALCSFQVRPARKDSLVLLASLVSRVRMDRLVTIGNLSVTNTDVRITASS